MKRALRAYNQPSVLTVCIITIHSLTFCSNAKSVLNFPLYFLVRVWGVEHRLHYDVTVFAALWLPEHYAGRMLTAIQVTLSSEEQLALQGFAGICKRR